MRVFGKTFFEKRTAEERAAEAVTNGALKAQARTLKEMGRNKARLSDAYNAASGVTAGFALIKEMGGFSYTVTNDGESVSIRTSLEKDGRSLWVQVDPNGRFWTYYSRGTGYPNFDVEKIGRGAGATRKLLEQVSYTVRRKNLAP